MREVATGKTKRDEKTKRRGRRIVRGGEIVANRVQALLSKIFELAEEWKLRPDGSNPCRGLKRYTENKVERFLSTDELSRLGEALAAAERGELMIGEVKETSPGAKRRRGGQWKTGPRSEFPSAIAAIRLLLFTGCRVGEILGLQWTHVHLDRKLLLLPDSKTGAKAVYLSEAAVKVLAAIKRIPDRNYVSLARNPASQYCRFVGRGFICVQPRTSNICDCMTSGTLCQRRSRRRTSLPVIGALLGHSQPTTTARYAHLAASPLHEAVDAIGAKIVAAMMPQQRA